MHSTRVVFDGQHKSQAARSEVYFSSIFLTTANGVARSINVDQNDYRDHEFILTVFISTTFKADSNAVHFQIANQCSTFSNYLSAFCFNNKTQLLNSIT